MVFCEQIKLFIMDAKTRRELIKKVGAFIGRINKIPGVRATWHNGDIRGGIVEVEVPYADVFLTDPGDFNHTDFFVITFTKICLRDSQDNPNKVYQEWLEKSIGKRTRAGYFKMSVRAFHARIEKLIRSYATNVSPN